jgi:hypothetical protein
MPGASNEDVAAVPLGQRRGQYTPISASATAQRGGGVRDLGAVIEIPIIAEELVTRPVVVKEVLRGRKEVLRGREERVAEPQIIRATLRKEAAQLTHDGDVVVRDETH